MSCESVQSRLSELIDSEGGLSAEERTTVERHLRSCVPCRRVFRDLEELGHRAREIEPGIEPEHELWPGIASRIEAGPSAPSSLPRRRTALWRWGLAAAAALAAGLSVPALVQWVEGPGPSPQALAERESDRLAYDRLLAEAALARVEDGTLQPRRDLEVLLAGQRGRLDAEVIATFEAEADRLQRAIGEIHLALEEQPDSRQLRLLLAARYRQERDLLQRVSRV